MPGPYRQFGVAARISGQPMMQSYTLEYGLNSGKSQTPQAMKPGSPAAARYDLGIRDYLALKLGRGKYRNLYVFPLPILKLFVSPSFLLAQIPSPPILHSSISCIQTVFLPEPDTRIHPPSFDLSLARFYINKYTPTFTRKNPAVLKIISRLLEEFGKYHNLSDTASGTFRYFLSSS
jgi:hypothetical protein